jgi:hypothetical protein
VAVFANTIPGFVLFAAKILVMGPWCVLIQKFYIVNIPVGFRQLLLAWGLGDPGWRPTAWLAVLIFAGSKLIRLFSIYL